MPVPDTVRAPLERLTPGRGPLVEAIARRLRAMEGLEVPPEAWPSEIPPHLAMGFEVLDDAGARRLARELAALRSLPAFGRDALLACTVSANRLERLWDALRNRGPAEQP